MQTDSTQTHSISQIVTKIPQLVSKEDVTQMINLQMSAIDRLEATNKSLHSCNILARDKYATTMKLFKRTAKQMNDSKKDLDIVYKKIIELKNKIRAERPDLFVNRPSDEEEEEDNDNKPQQPQEQIEKKPRDEHMSSIDTRPFHRSAEIAIVKPER